MTDAGSPLAPISDVDDLLARLASWCDDQRALTLVRLPPMSDAAIDGIPQLPTSFPFPLPTPYDPARFVVLAGYRALLRRAGGLHIEHEGEPWGVVHLYRPGDCARAHCGARYTLCDAWSTAGTTVDDREITTTALISFASIGFSMESSRWCFHLGPGAPLPIYEESNDYECLAGTYVDTGEPLSTFYKPVFPSFEAWFTTLVDVVIARPFAPGDDDALVQRLFDAARR